jgi:hypothetical protein
MHKYTIHNTLLAPCYSYMFQPSKDHPEEVRLIHFHSKVSKMCSRCTIQFTEQRVLYYTADTCICRVI